MSGGAQLDFVEVAAGEYSPDPQNQTLKRENMHVYVYIKAERARSQYKVAEAPRALVSSSSHQSCLKNVSVTHTVEMYIKMKHFECRIQICWVDPISLLRSGVGFNGSFASDPNWTSAAKAHQKVLLFVHFGRHFKRNVSSKHLNILLECRWKTG